MTDYDRTSRMTVSQRDDSSYTTQQPRHAEARSPVQGLMIVALRPESKARAAGMEKGDVIVQYDGVRDLTTDKLAALTCRKPQLGTLSRVVFVRRGTERSVPLPVGPLGISVMNSDGRVASARNSLFVLRYRTYKVVLNVIWYSLGILIFGFAAVVLPAEYGLTFKGLIAAFMYSTLAFSLMWVCFDMLLFKEIRLYGDKIVKVWKVSRENEVYLAEAKVQGVNIPPVSVKRICKQGMSFWWSPIKGVVYYEYLADREDVRKLNGLLADLSGRTAIEFEGISTRMASLMREDNRNWRCQTRMS